MGAAALLLTCALCCVYTSALAAAVTAPSGAATLYTFHGIGTQNYTMQTNSSYLNTGAVANLYDGSVVRAHHFFDSQGPVFELVDGAGLVHGTVLTKQASPRQADDGGFGSVAELLLVARDGEGALANVTYIQRLNTLGGMAPTELYALPAYNGTSNFQLAVPYQADYVFLTGGGTGGARRSY